MLTEPSPVTAGVTPNEIGVPRTADGTELSTAPTGGAVASVIPRSDQLLSATACAVTAPLSELAGASERVAFCTLPLTPFTSKRRKLRTTGEPSVRILLMPPKLVFGRLTST